jgi:putative transposase
MRKSQYTDQQIALALKRVEADTPVLEVRLKYGIGEQTCYRWKKKFGQTPPSEVTIA